MRRAVRDLESRARTPDPGRRRRFDSPFCTTAAISTTSMRCSRSSDASPSGFRPC